ncbi:hypothetical protein [Vulcanisaeta sp. JCM 16161]|uniref:hypothetical protein n=1 Tax=Vulcanisaeta sp. JCM 16161 TaxID=1295372 RepID=UPI001FB3759D|nr:hypothetical protein [Vulcanisaeta sp. JCM 16161]
MQKTIFPGKSSRVWLLAGIISVAIIIAIMSMPEVLEPLAKYIVKSMGRWLSYSIPQ